jgi:transposase
LSQRPAPARLLAGPQRHIPGKLLIVSDGLPAHRSRAVWEFVRQQRGNLRLEFLPAYAPELNPTEYIWGQGGTIFAFSFDDWLEYHRA